MPGARRTTLARALLGFAVAVLLAGSMSAAAEARSASTTATRADPIGGLVGLLFPSTTVAAAAPPTTATPTTTPPTTVPPTTAPTTATTVAPTTTTVVAAPPATGNQTGLTRVRVTIETTAAWVTLTLRGMSVYESRVVEQVGNAHITSLGGTSIAIAGDGRVVVDAVMTLPAGSATGVSMCKNYLGPATVTFTRRTDADAVVSRFTNPGTSTSTAQGCENPASYDIDHAALAGPVRWPARHDARPLVLANYYPWYDATTLAHDFGDDPVGPADTSDPAQVAQQVALAAASGIDGFVVEYEGTRTFDPRIESTFAAADAQPGFQSALMLDFDILGNRWGWTGPDMLDPIMSMVARLAAHPSQLKVQDQPVVFLYGTERLDAQQWSAALERLRVATGVRPFVVTDNQRIPSPGMYTYTVRDQGQDGLQTWSDGALRERQARPGLTGDPSPLWVAPVTPGYDDRRLGRLQPVYVDRAGGQRYDQMWAASLATLPDWIMVTSWNEYYEQTHVMPGNTTGTRALEQTTTWSAQFHRTG